MNTKVMIVGLGGVGSEIVSELERVTDGSKETNVRFVIIDTDINTTARLRREGFKGGIVQLAERMTVGEYLEEYQEAKEWFLENSILSWKPMTEGAGQIRAVSRLAFELAEKDEIKFSPLYDAIRELHISRGEILDGEDSAFRIIIVSTLAGGTGSGILLPLAIHLRKYMSEVYKRKDVIIRGVFLMSDCLEMLVQDTTERKSLRGNTYAAVKELDSFMKKADGYLRSEYPTITLDAKEEETVPLSYNFCYLFSARSEKSNEQGSLQDLKSYVVQCIYAQILGPMQELNNSIEDNVLKSTMISERKDGMTEFNRYCSAGISVLKYPYQEILQFLTLQKTLEIFSEQWLEIDNAYVGEKEKLLKKERDGYFVKMMPRDQFYVRYIRMSDGRSPLIKQIKKEVEGEGEKERWQEYLEELDKNIESSFEEQKKQWESEYAHCKSRIMSIRKQKRVRTLDSVKYLAEMFEKLQKKCLSEVGKYNILVKSKYFGILSDEDYIGPWHFCFWIKNQKGLMHVNFVRYFLYCVVQELKEKCKKVEENIGKLEEELESVTRLKESIWNKRQTQWLKWNKGFFSEICEDYENNLSSLEEYCKHKIERYTYLIGIETLQNISKGLEEFYDAYEYNRYIFSQKQETIFNQLTGKKDSTVTYVYTQQTQLEDLLKRVTDYERDKETNSRLSEVVFQKIWETLDEEKEQRKEKIQEIFQKDCLEFWEKNLRVGYAHELDLNIVEALLKEGMSKEKSTNRKYKYLKEKLNKMWDRTVPYLQIGNVGNLGQVKSFCAYSGDIFSEDKEVNYILERELKQKGGTDASGEVDKYTLIFYKAVYNLRAVDVKEFSAGLDRENDTLRKKMEFLDFPPEAGTTFKNYYEIINIQDITKLTPHIDKRWSNIFEMPDLNSNFTLLRKKKICQALFLLWLEGNLQKQEKEERKYSCHINGSRQEYPLLATVLVALSESLREVKDIFGRWESQVEQDVQMGRSFEESNIGILGAERQEQFIIGIFWLPCQYFKEQPRSRWDESLLYHMMEAIIDLYQNVVGRFYDGFRYDIEFQGMIKQAYRMLRRTDSEASIYCQNAIKDICRAKGFYGILTKLE